MNVFDIETDGFNPTKIHCLSYSDEAGSVTTLTDYDEMREFITTSKCLVGHHIIGYDLPVIKKLLGVEPKGFVIDTLPLSWYLNFNRVKHGLESYGDDYGISKPKVLDWSEQPLYVYINRCEEDVKINFALWSDLERKLNRLYDGEYMPVVRYLNFKMECLQKQEELGWRLDVDKAQVLHDDWVLESEKTSRALSEVMPERTLTRKVSPPAKMHNQDGSLSSHGETWLQRLYDAGLPDTHSEPFDMVVGTEPGNPKSVPQVKDWLFDLGWKPRTFKFVREGKSERKVPQVRKDGELCESVVNLISVDPGVKLLEGLTVLNHRISFMSNLLKYHEDGVLRAGAMGLTNTFRFKHRNPLVNLPGVDKPYGKDIRSCLIAPKGKKTCGADMVSLENTTKQHYMLPFDPEYVEEMQKEGFDPHLDLAVFNGDITHEDVAKHNANIIDLSAMRKAYKKTNYSALYGIQPLGLSRDSGVSVQEATRLLVAFDKRNWAVKEAMKHVKTRKVYPDTYVQNPVSGFWHHLRNDKDKFSTVNQSTGVFCFDRWLQECFKIGLFPVAQFHDEGVWMVPEGDEELVEDQLKGAIAMVNNDISLDVDLDVDVQFGDNYAEVH